MIKNYYISDYETSLDYTINFKYLSKDIRIVQLGDQLKDTIITILWSGYIQLYVLIVLFVVVDNIGSASTINSTCCGCFQRRSRESLLEMYSIRARCSNYKQHTEVVRLRPPKCFTNETLTNKVKKKSKNLQGNANFEDFEFADDAISLDET